MKGGGADTAGSKNLVHLGVVDDATLAELYRRAAALVFPSLYEGFGLPVVEAMALGCPVVASDIPVLREVTGGLAYFVDPADPSSIARGIRAALRDGRDPARVRSSRERAAEFSWERSANALRAAIERAVSSPSRPV